MHTMHILFLRRCLEGELPLSFEKSEFSFGRWSRPNFVLCPNPPYGRLKVFSDDDDVFLSGYIPSSVFSISDLRSKISFHNSFAITLCYCPIHLGIP